MKSNLKNVFQYFPGISDEALQNSYTQSDTLKFSVCGFQFLITISLNDFTTSKYGLHVWNNALLRVV